MGSLKRKLILSIFSTVLTVVCLTSTTYAWFARNSEAWTEEFNFEIENYDNLLISIDGENYRSSISNDLLKKAIVAKANNINVLDDSNSSNPVLTSSYVDSEFNKIRINAVSTSNLIDFTTIDETSGTDGYFNIVSADKYDYLAFDLYFRVAASSVADKIYDLTFVSDEYSSNSDSNVPVSYLQAPDASSVIYSEFKAGDTEYKADDVVSVNLTNAMRIGVITDSGSKVIYEPYEGLGSYAIEGGEGIYSPDNNIMLQHLNAYGKYDLLPLEDVLDSDSNSVYQNTEKSFNNEVSLGVFEQTTESQYNDIKITVAIWLEGYDADYLSTVDLTRLTCYLSFCKKERA